MPSKSLHGTHERDPIVFDAARASDTPVAWNLAGDYRCPLAKVIELHVNPMNECVRSFGFRSA